MYYGYDYSDPQAILAGLGTYFACVAFFVVAIVALQIWLYWRVLSKAGYNGAWALLILVPFIGAFASFGILLVLAFGDWPALRRQAYAPPAVPSYQPPYQPPAPPAAAPPAQQYQGYGGPAAPPAPAPYTPPAPPVQAMPEPSAPPVQAMPEPPAPAAPEPAPQAPPTEPSAPPAPPADQG